MVSSIFIYNIAHTHNSSPNMGFIPGNSPASNSKSCHLLREADAEANWVCYENCWYKIKYLYKKYIFGLLEHIFIDEEC